MAKLKGTWNVVTEIMRENGFKAKRKVFPTGLEFTIRQMLNQAYVKGYFNGRQSK